MEPVGVMDYWHKQIPPMGGKDHTHLNKLGYETVSDMLYAALMQQYDRYLVNLANQPSEPFAEAPSTDQ